MAKIVIDGEIFEVNAENNLLQECLSQGLDLPYFCWHPCMGSVGACRQCAVKQYRDENDENGLIVMACMTPIKDGSIISIKDEEVKYFREQVIESLMISHPHDCPVCEEGGECHLQDMTQMSGHNYRRYDRKKVTHRNQYLGPFINHEMNRCITCYRCVRYYQDYAGGTDLAAMAAHHHVYFGRHEEGVLENEFSGNLVEVCPTGVFTDKPFSEHYSRKWDLQSAPSICASCSVGCNTSPGERYGSLRRLVNRYHPDVNGYFLCDRGRFGSGFVNSEKRLKNAFCLDINKGNKDKEIVDINDAVAKLKELTSTGNTIGIGSPRSSIESNYALLEYVGAENFYSGYSDVEHEIYQTILNVHSNSLFHCPSIKEIEQADAILIVGEDVTNTAPRIALALRQSIRNMALDLARAGRIPVWQDAAVRELAQSARSPLHILSGFSTRLDDVSKTTTTHCMEYLTVLTAKLASVLDDSAPKVDSSYKIDADLVQGIAADLVSAKHPLIISGGGCENSDLVRATVNVARALSNARSKIQSTELISTAETRPWVDLCLLMPEVNSMGLAQMQCEPKNTLGSALEKMKNGEVDAAIVIENDLFRRAPETDVDMALSAVKSVVVMDQIDSKTVNRASLVLPVTSFAEQEGCHVNYEGRVQLSYQVYESVSDSKPCWNWLALLKQKETKQKETKETEAKQVDENHNVRIDTPYAIAQRCGKKLDSFSQLGNVYPHGENLLGNMKVPRQPHRYSGRTAMHAHENVHEAKPTQDSESVMSFSMEGISTMKDSNILATSWAPSWNSNQSITKFQQEVGGELTEARDDIFLTSGTEQEGGYLSLNKDSAAMEDQSGQGGFNRITIKQIFGSDELSAEASAIQQRLLPAYVCLSVEDAHKLELGEDDGVEIGGGNFPTYQLPVLRRRSIQSGTIAIYDGVGEIDSQQLGNKIQVKKASNCGSIALYENKNLLIADKCKEAVPS